MNVDTIKVPGKAAVAKLHELRSAFPSTGRYPFLIGDEEQWEILQESAEDDDEGSASIIERSLVYNVEQEIDELRSEIEEEGADGILGEWPGEEKAKGEITIHKDVLTGAIKPLVYLGIAKLQKPWQLPAIVNFGNWNECPSPPVHCAFHRKWEAEYGSQIVTISGSIVECLVTKPPKTKKTALELALQQYRYCGDIVDQGYDSINALASTLINSPYWYFWWD